MSTPVGTWLVQGIARLDPIVFRWTRGRMTAGGPILIPMLLLTTTGHRSGARRDAMLVYTDVGGDAHVVASNFGRANHPAWSLNLDANPNATMQVGAERLPVVALRLGEGEVEAIWPRLVENLPTYSVYRQKTQRPFKV